MTRTLCAMACYAASHVCARIGLRFEMSDLRDRCARADICLDVAESARVQARILEMRRFQ